GAPSPAEGYVGQVHRMLEAGTGQAWRVLNLSRSGGRISDVLTRQLPILESLDVAPDLVTCAVGANDVIRRTPLSQVEAELREIMRRLPAGSVVATLPQGLWRERAAPIDQLVKAEAAGFGLRVADVHAHTGPPWDGKYAEDRFHPGVLGYADWATAFAEALEL
ncbi:MAG: hypothetical protein QOI56_458, partial [Actinomycetota bacterium]|nr:hypothetical protein [Actinomycetota bacterium]